MDPIVLLAVLAVLSVPSLVLSYVAFRESARPSSAWRSWYADHLERVLLAHVDRETLARELGPGWPPIAPNPRNSPRA